MTATVTDIASKPKAAKRSSKRAEANAKKKGKAKSKAPAQAPAKAGHNQYAQLVRGYVYRLESLNRDRQNALEPIRQDTKELGKEVKDAGYKMKAIREIVRRRAMSREDLDLVDQYELALGTQEEKTE